MNKNMKNQMKQTLAPVFGAILLSGLLGQTAQATLLSESGTSILADAFGTATGPEALTVSWSVAENVSLVYTYSYVVNNPLGDVLLNNNGSPTLTPEIVDAFGLGFDTLAPNAYVLNSQVGGIADQNNGLSGLFWSFNAIQPNTSSPILSFQSLLPPVPGFADAQDANPPSPWSSFPNGQPVPVPGEPSVPDSTNTFALLGSVLLLLPLRSILKAKASLPQ